MVANYLWFLNGFICRSKMVFVGKEKPIDEAVSVSKKVAIQSGILSRPRNPPNPFR